MSEKPLPEDPIGPPPGPTLETESQVRAFLAAIIDSFDGAMIGKTLDGVVRSWNPGAERLFGYTAAEMMGHPITILLPPERVSEEQLILARLRKGERLENYETVRVTKDGRRIEVALTVSPIRDASGTLIGASKIARDISGVKEARRSLRDSEERFRTLADHIAQLAWMAHPDGWIFWYNQRWLDYTGTTLEEMQGWGWQQVHHPDHVETVTENFRRAFEAGEAWEDTFPLKSATGEYRWFLSRALPIRDDTGEIVRWFGTNTDITERMEMEERLRADDRRKDQFLATLAHELRNPLAPIVHSVELLRHQPNEQQADRALATLERQSRHLVRLVDDLLDISRITRGIVELRTERVDLRTVLSDALETSQSAIETDGHRFDLRLPDTPVALDADPTRLAQVFANLLHNAAKFTPSGGEIVLRTERHDDTVTVVVADSGPGIPAEMRDRVFELFVQGEAGRRGGSSGLGIGLTLVRSLVELHGGSVRARERTAGSGVAMEVRLPVATDRAADPAAEPTRTASTAGLKVLVVDDNRDAADSLYYLIESQGHEARVVYDGPSALETGDAFHPDLMLLDLGMPGMDGFETARRVRQRDWGRATHLAALTGWGQESDRQRTREAGFDRHLVKPIAPQLLFALLDELTG